MGSKKRGHLSTLWWLLLRPIKGQLGIKNKKLSIKVGHIKTCTIFLSYQMSKTTHYFLPKK